MESFDNGEFNELENGIECLYWGFDLLRGIYDSLRFKCFVSVLMMLDCSCGG